MIVDKPTNSYEHSTGAVQISFVSLDEKSFGASFNSVNYGFKLDGANAQHRWHKAVEFVKTSPRPRSGKPLNKASKAIPIQNGLPGATKCVKAAFMLLIRTVFACSCAAPN